MYIFITANGAYKPYQILSGSKEQLEKAVRKLNSFQLASSVYTGDPASAAKRFSLPVVNLDKVIEL